MQLSSEEEDILGSIDDVLRNAIRMMKDEAYQKKIWFKSVDSTEKTEVSTYEDAMTFFLDSCEGIFGYPTCIIFLGKENYDPLKRLYELAYKHFFEIDRRLNLDVWKAEDLLNDPNWHDIQTLSAEVELTLQKFLKRHDFE